MKKVILNDLGITINIFPKKYPTIIRKAVQMNPPIRFRIT